MKRIEPGSFLTLHYRVTGPEGAAVIDTFGVQPATLSLGTGELAPAMEACLIGLEEGSRASFDLPPGKAFGERSQALVRRLSKAALAGIGDADADYAVGDVVRFPTPDGQASFAGVVRVVEDDGCIFDFNHPLAGRAVTFEVEVVGVLAG
ncbi:MAG TPA: FKBP-type peptidyl-prolyl cis-trans isomerase [Caldimonas sp.]|nr:FKBP-type peptidyl-prolyl cis-trans isomerase [Caldimonas sp.]